MAKNKKKKRTKTTLDCYGILPEGCKVGKITTSKMYPKNNIEFKSLGDLGKW